MGYMYMSRAFQKPESKDSVGNTPGPRFTSTGRDRTLSQDRDKRSTSTAEDIQQDRRNAKSRNGSLESR